jgi:SAM-dependent methyltransferase
LLAERAQPTASPLEYRFWDVFYQQKRDRFFKHRYHLRAEFAELVPASVQADPRRHVPPHVPLFPLSSDERIQLEQASEPSAWRMSAFEPGLVQDSLLVAECGCGVGNALIPLLRANPRLFFFAFDFAPAAIRLLMLQPEYDKARVFAYVSDLVAPVSSSLDEQSPTGQVLDVDAGATAKLDRWTPGVYRAPPRQCHYVTCVWTLSAVPADLLPLAAARLAAMLQPGGTLLVRDYAVGDLAELRHPACARVDTDASLHEYIRGDGTRVHYFQVAELEELFRSVGLRNEYLHTVDRQVVNRKERLVMHRKWIAGKWTKPNQEPCFSYPAPKNG